MSEDTATSIARFRNHLAERGHSYKTIADYSGWLSRIRAWAEADTDLTDLTAYQLLTYTEHQVPLHRTARVQLRQAVRWFQEANDLDPTWQVVRVPAEDTPLCRALDPEPARALFRAAVSWEEGPEGLAVLLGQQQGLRRAEIAGLEWSGLDSTWERLSFIGKGPKSATIPLHPVVQDKLAWWAECSTPSYRIGPGTEYLFEGRGQRPHVNPTTVWTWVRRLGEHAGVPVTTHQLRHTFGAEVNDNTGDLRLAQELLRHTKVTTTQRYTRVTWSNMLNGLMKVDYS